MSNRDEQSPVLPLEGRRSILAQWPAGSFCSTCGAIAEEGYVGPVDGGRAFFPDPRLVLVCRPCALASIGVDDDGFERHRCAGGCSDRLHVDLVPIDDTALAPHERVERTAVVAPRYGGTPWAVVDVSPADATLAMACGMPSASAPRLMAIWLEIDRPLQWTPVGTARAPRFR